MTRIPLIRVAAAALGGLAAATALFGLLIVADAGRGFPRVASSTPGWVVPLAAGGLVGAIAWLLLSDRGSQREGSTQPQSTLCSSCGSPVMSDWRLCPYCGHFIEAEQPGEGYSAQV